MLALHPPVPAAVIVKLAAVTLSGVPLSTPVVVFKLIHAGNEPADTLHVAVPGTVSVRVTL